MRNHRPSASTLSASIYGSTYCYFFQSYTWEAATKCGQGPISYKWFTSYDGFNWNFKSSNEFYSEVFYSEGNRYRYLRLRVTSNGQVSEAFSSIYVEGNIQGSRIASSDDRNTTTYPAPISWKKSNSERGEREKNILTIDQLYPNPSQATFALNFNTPIEQDISLDLIDVFGNTINLFAKEHYQKGKFSKNLNVNNLSSGTYVVKLSSDIESATTKLIIIK